MPPLQCQSVSIACLSKCSNELYKNEKRSSRTNINRNLQMGNRYRQSSPRRDQVKQHIAPDAIFSNSLSPMWANHYPQIFRAWWDVALRPPMNRRATLQRPINRTFGIGLKPCKPDLSGAGGDSSATSSPSGKMWVKVSPQGGGGIGRLNLIHTGGRQGIPANDYSTSSEKGQRISSRT